MLIHICWGIDKAGIGPAGPRCGASTWAATAESLESIGLSSTELRPSSFGDRFPVTRKEVGVRVCLRTEWGYSGGPGGTRRSFYHVGLGCGRCCREKGASNWDRRERVSGPRLELGGGFVRQQGIMAGIPEAVWEVWSQTWEAAKAGGVPWMAPLTGVVSCEHFLPGAFPV